MTIPKNARYNYCCKKANEFLVSEKITSLPFDADAIIRKHKWAKLKYSFLANQHNVTINDICETYGSRDAYTIFNGHNYTIAYNDMINTKQRIYFTKLHEIGHIYLGHFTEFDETILSRYNITKPQYKVLENEANCFARNILAPACIIQKFEPLSFYKISKILEITLQAAKSRLSFLDEDLYYLPYEGKVRQINQFHDFIYRKHCLNCGHTFISEDAKYCPICGYSKLKWGIGNVHYKKGVALDKDHRAIRCPRCDNEDIGESDMYCPICGAYLYQYCADKTDTDINGNEYVVEEGCGCKLDSNARYCTQCGNESTFFKNGYLKKWEQEKAENEAAAAKQNGNPHK